MYHISTEVDKPCIDWMYSYTKALMENRGLRIGDCDVMLKLIERVIDMYQQAINKAYYIDNPRSPKQVVEYLKMLSRETDPNSVDYVYEICFVNGKWTSNAEALEELSKLGYQFADDMLMFRKYDGLAKGIKQLMKFKDKDGFVHPETSLGVTNRLQFSNPPIMSIPKKLLWWLVIPPKEGYSIYSADIKNQEPSIMINLLGMDDLKPGLVSDEGLYEYMFREALKPIAVCNVSKSDKAKLWDNDKLDTLRIVSPSLYCSVKPDTNNVYYNNERVVRIQQRYAEMNGEKVEGLPELPETIKIITDSGMIYDVEVEWDIQSALKNGKMKFKDGVVAIQGTLKGVELEIGESERKQFKTSWLAYTYGGYRGTIQSSCKTINGDRVYDFMNGIEAFRRYKSLRDKAVKNKAKYVRTAFGSLIPVEATSDSMRRRRMLDYPIQGSGADVLSLLMKHFNGEVQQRGLENDMEIYFTRHDEVVILVSNSYEKEHGESDVKNILDDIFEHRIDDWTPFMVEITKADRNLVYDMITREIKEDGIRIDYN